MIPLVGSHRRLGGVHWAVGWGSPEKKLGTPGGVLEGWPVRRRTGDEELFRGGEVALGPAVRPVVAGGSGGAG